MNQKTSLKNWSKSDKRAIAYALGCAAFCAVLTALYIKEKDCKHALFQGTSTVINTTYVAKMLRNANQKAKQRN